MGHVESGVGHAVEVLSFFDVQLAVVFCNFPIEKEFKASKLPSSNILQLSWKTNPIILTEGLRLGGQRLWCYTCRRGRQLQSCLSWVFLLFGYWSIGYLVLRSLAILNNFG